MTAPRPRHAGLRALAPLGLALAAGVAAAALPRPSLAAAQPSARRSPPPPDSTRGKRFLTVIRDSGRVVETTPIDSAGRPIGEMVRTARLSAGAGSRQRDSVLFVLDGQELRDGMRSDSVVAKLDLARIASLEVLKGDLAARKYGERGRNGVVEITTKAAAPKP